MGSASIRVVAVVLASLLLFQLLSFMQFNQFLWQPELFVHNTLSINPSTDTETRNDLSINPSTDTETRRDDEIAYNLTSNMPVVVGIEQKLDAGMMMGIQRTRAKSLTKSLQFLTSADAMEKSCGVVYYYHTPSTGGNSINKWIKSMDNIEYFNSWCNGSGMKNVEPCSKRHEKLMDLFVSNFTTTNTWKFAQAHLRNYGADNSVEQMKRWRSTVEAHGCRFVATTVFRNPMAHFFSLHGKGKHTVENYIEVFRGQLDFFLYNSAKPNTEDRQKKVWRAIDLLAEHFDYVFYENHSLFTETILNITGWKPQPMPHGNGKGSKGTIYSKEHISDVFARLDALGDIDFINYVKYTYDPSSLLSLLG